MSRLRQKAAEDRYVIPYHTDFVGLLCDEPCQWIPKKPREGETRGCSVIKVGCRRSTFEMSLFLVTLASAGAVRLS